MVRNGISKGLEASSLIECEPGELGRFLSNHQAGTAEHPNHARAHSRVFGKNEKRDRQIFEGERKV